MRKRNLIAALTAVSVISGCGTSPEPAKDLPAVSLSVWCPEEDMEVMKEITDSFTEAHKDEAVFSITLSAESEETCKSTVLASPESAADIFAFAFDQFESLRSGGALLPITLNTDKVIADNGGKDNEAIVGASFNGTLYAYPETASNGYFLYYNSAYFTEEDVKSFDKMLDIAASNGKKVTMDLTSGWYLYSFFKAAGMSVDMNADGITNSCNWNAVDNEVKGVDVAQALLDICKHDGFINGSDDDFKKGVTDGTIIAGVNGTWNSSVVEAAWGDNYAAAPLPSYKAGGKELQMHSFAGYKYVGVNAYTGNPEWAMALAEWITNEDSQMLRFKKRGEGPSNVKAAASPEVQSAPAIAALSKQSAYGHIQNVADTFWTPSYMFGTVICSGNSDGRDLQELLDETTAEITAPPEG